MIFSKDEEAMEFIRRLRSGPLSLTTLAKTVKVKLKVLITKEANKMRFTKEEQCACLYEKLLKSLLCRTRLHS